MRNTPRSYQAWADQRAARARRNETIALLAAAAASLIIGILLIGQLLFGRLRWHTWSEPTAYAIGGALGLLVVAMLIAPEPVLTALSRGFRALSGALFLVIGSLLTGLLYVLTLPLAATIGRRGLTKRHPTAQAWVDPRERDAWQHGTWTPKHVHVESTGKRQSTIGQALRVFIEQRNYLLLALVIALLMLATVTMFAKSSAVAPFVYTLF